MITSSKLNKLSKQDLINLILRLNDKSKANFKYELEFYLSQKEFENNKKLIQDYEKSANEFTEYYSSLKDKYKLPDKCPLPLLYKTLKEEEYDHLAQLEKKYHKAMERL